MDMLKLVVLLAVLVEGNAQTGLLSQCIKSQNSAFSEQCFRPVSLLLVAGDVIGTLLSGRRELKTLCRPENIDKINTFIECYYDVRIKCTPTKWQKAIERSSDQIGALKYLCGNQKDMSTLCITSNYKALTECLQRDTPVALTVDDHLNFTCISNHVIASCLRKTFLSECYRKIAEVMTHAFELQFTTMCASRLTSGAVVIGQSLFQLVLGIVVLCFMDFKF